MSLLEKFQLNWKENFFHLSSVNCHLVLAVSGGVDSVILTDLIYKNGFDFSVAHCNFQLRNEESERDEIFVRSLAKKYNKQFFVKKFDTKKYAEQHKISIQEAARKLRYKWFNEIISRQQLIVNQSTNQPINQLTLYVATAHHANDNIETLLFNFFRGTGISGLHGILLNHNKTIRPLLFAKKHEIIEYAKENNLGWVEDSSNESEKYSRNFLRLQLIPSLKKIFSDIEENLLSNIERFKEAETLYQQAIEQHRKKLIEKKANEFHIPILKLQKSEPLNSILWEIIRDFNFHSAQIYEVKKLFNAENSSYIESSTHRIIKNRNWLIIAPLLSENAQHILIKKNDKEIVFENGILKFEQQSASNSKLQTSIFVASLDANKIKFPLLLRKWKPGDYFYPLGMNKKKKLSKCFIDQKLSKTEKEKIWILETNKKIVWIIGLRIDDRFKITSSTKNVLNINFKVFS
ncbi:MAG: tRNA lysidine(34) synthetase TilS [Chitinophagaceae bacterium]